MGKDHNILIIHHEPEYYFETLCNRFPEVHFHKGRNDKEVQKQMAAVQPEILLSYRNDGVSTKTQVMAARDECIQWIQVAGAGYDHIGDLDQIGCPVTNCSGVLSKFQAETVIGAMLNLNFGFFRYQQQQQEKIYRKLPWQSLEGKTLLLVGLGHIAKAVATQARHFGMRVIAVRSRLQDSPEVDAVFTPETLPDLLPEADFVSLHLPYNETTRHFFDATMLEAMKESAYLINTARGNIVDEDALIQALQKTAIAGAYLDVFSEEPLPQSNPLWLLDNVLLTPHYCDAVEDWRERFAAFFADNLQRWLDDKPLSNLIKA